jgi:hypothetical protein
VLDLVVETKTGLGFDNGLDDAVNRILGNLATRTLPNGLGGQERLIKGGTPTENLVANVVAVKYAWHESLYRQARIMRLQGLTGPIARHWLVGLAPRRTTFQGGTPTG